MLGYRSLFTVETTADATSTILGQVDAWLRSKGYDADAIQANSDVGQLAPGVQAVITTEDLQDGSTSALFTLREDTDVRGAWITQIIGHTPGSPGSKPWVWIDVEQEGVTDVWAARPRIARSILKELPGDDHGAILAPSPTVVTPAGVPALARVLTSRERRAPVFVAGSSDEIPLARWQEYVEGLLAETVGLSAGYVLDAAATSKLAALIGVRHAVAPGTLRTYLPGLDPGSDLDALRHRFLTTETIINTAPQRIRKSLGLRARDLALVTPVPRWAAQVETRLLEATDSRVLGWRPTALVTIPASAPAPLEPSAPAFEPIVKNPTTALPKELAESPTIERHLTTPDADTPQAGNVTDSPLEELARQLFASDLDATLLEELAAERGRAVVAEAEIHRLETSLVRATDRAKALNDRVLNLEDELAEARWESEDAQLEWAQSVMDGDELERTVLSLRKHLMEAGAVQAAWDPLPAAVGLDLVPEGFAEILVRFSAFEYLKFTGKPDPCDDLDQRMPIGAAAKTWRALRALEDYARGKANGVVSSSVHQYLASPPDGYRTFSINRHAATESEDVQKNPKFADPRTLPVPHEVNSSGIVFMGAHFKIANMARVSPRLHYFDATAIDGHIYVGYIGAHLPTGMTN